MQYSILISFLSIAAAQQSAFCVASGTQPNIGTQNQNGKATCSSTIQGLLPSAEKMVSTIITNPPSGSTVSGAAGFLVEFTTTKLASGLLQDVNTMYLKIPQTLQPATGFIQGASSVNIQQLPSKLKAPAAQQVAFQAISNAAADAAGTTKHVVNIAAGQITSKGLHRVCTLAISVSGPPVVMPVAQR